jgi:hypothetical protein
MKMKYLHKIYIGLFFLSILPDPVFSIQGFEVLKELELQRLHIRNDQAGSKEQLVGITQDIQKILEGTQSQIDFKRKATDAEYERARFHVLDTTIAQYKSVKGLQLETTQENFNKYVFCELNQDLLQDSNPHSQQYCSHLTALYIMGRAAFELVSTPRAYFSWNNDFLINHVTEQVVTGAYVLHPIIKNYITQMIGNALQVEDRKKKFRPFVEKYLGSNFYKTYLSLMYGMADTPKADQALIEIAQEAKRPLYTFNLFSDAPIFPQIKAEPVLKDTLQFIHNLRIAFNQSSGNIRGGQSVHTFNSLFVAPYRDRALQEAERSFMPNKQLGVERVKAEVYEYYNNHKGDFEDLSPTSKHKELYKKALDTSFENLARHLSGNIVEASETKLNMPEIISAVWDVSTRLQQLKDRKKQDLLKRLQVLTQAQYAHAFGQIKSTLDNSSIDLCAKVVGTIAENALTGGGCYPGLAGRFFSDYCHLLMEFYQADDQYFDIPAPKDLLETK